MKYYVCYLLFLITIILNLSGNLYYFYIGNFNRYIINCFFFTDNVESNCVDSLGSTVEEGDSFLSTPCEMCQCINFKPTNCKLLECTKPIPEVKNFVSRNTLKIYK